MALVYKRLGALQSNGTIGTGQTLYTASNVADTSTVISTISICNTSSSNYTYRIGVSTTTSFQTAGYIIYGATVASNDTVFLTLGITLDPTNRYLLVSAANSAVIFNVFGAENS